MFHAVVSRGRFSLPAPSVPRNRHVCNYYFYYNLKFLSRWFAFLVDNKQCSLWIMRHLLHFGYHGNLEHQMGYWLFSIYHSQIIIKWRNLFLLLLRWEYTILNMICFFVTVGTVPCCGCNAIACFIWSAPLCISSDLIWYTMYPCLCLIVFM